MARQVVLHDHFAKVARAALGSGHHPVGLERLRGGSKKGVYRLTMDDDSTVIVYSWHESENYWPTAGVADLCDPFSDASGIELFLAASKCLGRLGVRTPRIFLADQSQSYYPADIAVVEDVRGGNLETLLEQDPGRGRSTLIQLAGVLEAMYQQANPGFGKVALIDSGGTSCGESCEQVVLERARRDLAEAASRDTRIAACRDELADLLGSLAGKLRPRSEHRLIHGELGPDHVLVDQLGEPVIIDVEGLMYFDVEWEHAFLRIRFGEHYQQLKREDLDLPRLDFYTLAMRLSLVAGPLRIAAGDYPERDEMLEIAEYNLERALAYLVRD